MSDFITFRTKKDAVAYLDSITYLRCTNPETRHDYYTHAGQYVCYHGEYDRPYYIPRKYKNGWGIHAEYYYYNNVYNAPKDGRVDLWDEASLWDEDDNLPDIHHGNYDFMFGE